MQRGKKNRERERHRESKRLSERQTEAERGVRKTEILERMSCYIYFYFYFFLPKRYYDF